MEEYLNHDFFKEDAHNLKMYIINENEVPINSNNNNKEINKIKDHALSIIDIMALLNYFISKKKLKKKLKKLKILMYFLL